MTVRERKGPLMLTRFRFSPSRERKRPDLLTKLTFPPSRERKRLDLLTKSFLRLGGEGEHRIDSLGVQLGHPGYLGIGGAPFVFEVDCQFFTLLEG